jgi:hypothetical protein
MVNVPHDDFDWRSGGRSSACLAILEVNESLQQGDTVSASRHGDQNPASSETAVSQPGDQVFQKHVVSFGGIHWWYLKA